MASLNTVQLPDALWARPTIGRRPATFFHGFLADRGPLGQPALCGVTFSDPGPRTADVADEDRCPDCRRVLTRLTRERKDI